MKKVLLVAAVAGLAMVSCKKDYKCVCTSSSTVAGTTYTYETTITAKSTKKDATAWCEAGPKATTTVNGQAQTSSGGSNETCAIK